MGAYSQNHTLYIMGSCDQILQALLPFFWGGPGYEANNGMKLTLVVLLKTWLYKQLLKEPLLVLNSAVCRNKMYGQATFDA